MRGGRSCARAGLRDGGGAGEVGLSRMRTPRHSPRPGSTAFSREGRREARLQPFPGCLLSPWKRMWRRPCLPCAGLPCGPLRPTASFG